MILPLPVKPKFINQKFGETANLAYYKANGINFVGHNGIDFQAYHGQPIFASHDGTAFFEVDDKLGHGVVIRSNETFDYTSMQGVPMQAYFKTIYWHMASPEKEPNYPNPISYGNTGVPVNAGDFIGWADNTGTSTGDHVHFGFKPCNMGEPNNTWYNIDQNNGYMGCIDPLPYLGETFAEDLIVSHSFDTNIGIGERSKEVIELQRKLKTLGFFNGLVTGYYGPITKAAVYAFQLKYVATSWFDSVVVNHYRGDYVQTKTRNALNAI